MGFIYMKRYIAWIVILVLILSFGLNVSAKSGEPYKGYNYNAWNTAVSSPNAYYAGDVFTGDMLGVGPLNEPSDIFFRNEELYILDSGNSRIIVLDKSFKFVRVIDSFYMQDGTKLELAKPQGIFVCEDGKLIIADTENGRVVLCNADGTHASVYGRPEADIFPKNLQYKPIKVLLDNSGYLYVLIKDFYYGAAVFNTEKQFTGFFGANTVAVTAGLLAERFWKSILSEKQVEYSRNYVPVAYSNFDIDKKNFIYTATLISQTGMNQLKKLNKIGIDLLRDDNIISTFNKLRFGDKWPYTYFGQWHDTRFIDLDISDEGFISALDLSQGRVFRYDQACNLLYIMGGIVKQKGTFSTPVALETINDSIVVLDSAKRDITVFYPTKFGQLVNEAAFLYGKGEYSKAKPIWEQILKLNANYELAYVGIGRALVQQEKYEEALWYLRKGYDRVTYSNAYGVIRVKILQKYFWLIGTAIIFAVLWVFFGKRIKKFARARGIFSIPQPSSTETPLYVMIHPLAGYDGIRRTNRFSLLVGSVFIVFLWFIGSIIQRQATGFIINLNRPETLDITLIFMRTFGLLFLWCICNWAVSTLINGEGTFRRIWILCAYAITPMILSIFITTMLSNIVTYEEGALLNIVSVICGAWSAFLFFIAIKEVHQFNVSKTVFCIFLTIIGMALVLFIAVLFVSLIQQFNIFVQTITNEILFRTA